MYRRSPLSTVSINMIPGIVRTQNSPLPKTKSLFLSNPIISGKKNSVDKDWTLELPEEVINCHFSTKSAGHHLV